jgi:hypothetical protein
MINICYEHVLKYEYEHVLNLKIFLQCLGLNLEPSAC